MTLVSIAEGAAAHGFGGRLTLSVPLWLWLIGASLTLLISFAVVIDFLPRSWETKVYPRLVLLHSKSSFRPVARVFVWLCQASSVAALLLTIFAGLYGANDPNRNFAPLYLWVIVWVGFAFLSALVGDLWSRINPWRSMFDALAWVLTLLTGRSLNALWPYPAHFGVWPAVVLLMGFAVVEHAGFDVSSPRYIAVGLIAYSALTLTGMAAFGRHQWIQHAELFSVVFSLFARFSPIEFSTRFAGPGEQCDSALCRDRDTDCPAAGNCPLMSSNRPWDVTLRPPAVGLLNDKRSPPSMMLFVILLLASVTFDGFTETALWREVTSSVSAGEISTNRVTTSIVVWATAGLVGFTAFFTGLFLLCCSAMGQLGMKRELSSLRQPTLEIASRFVLTLVPIAIAYHLAHYVSVLISEGQLFLPLISDPLGRGWDLFGTADYVIDQAWVSTGSVWTFVVVAIVMGHLMSVYLSHVVALGICRERRSAIRTQVPMLSLMVVYTMSSLWLLAQPVAT